MAAAAAAPIRLRTSRSATSAAAARAASRWSSTARSSTASAPVWTALTSARRAARSRLTLSSRRSRCRSTRSSASLARSLLVRRRVPWHARSSRAHRPAVRALARGHRPRPGAGLRPQRLVRRLARRTHGIQVIFAVPGMVARDDLRLAAVRGARGVPVLRELGRTRSRPPRTLGAPVADFWRITLPAIRWAHRPTASCSRRPARSASSARSPSSPAASRARPRRSRSSSRSASSEFDLDRRLRGLVLSSPARGGHAASCPMNCSTARRP